MNPHGGITLIPMFLRKFYQGLYLGCPSGLCILPGLLESPDLVRPLCVLLDLNIILHNKKFFDTQFHIMTFVDIVPLIMKITYSIVYLV